MSDVAAGLCHAVCTSDPATSVYTGLESDCIRLVRILPQSQDDPTAAIRCTMRDFHLDDLPAYSALSYAWGGKPANCSITLDGQRFDVRKSLFGFLSHARNLAGSSLGWIFVDAISINQADDAERSYQVGLMSRIYSGATQVLAWLGPQYDASDLAMRELGRRAAYWQKRRNMLAIWSSPSGAAIRALCSRPYWSRLWVFQELSLAKRVQLVCGTATVSWSAFSKFILGMRSVVLTPRVGAMFEHQAMCMSPAIKMVQHASNQPGSTALWDLMFGLDYLRCAEPRDKVYALLGVAASTSPSVQPNYYISLPEMLNMVLKYRHGTKPPLDIEEVITQCAELETLLGVETGTIFIMKGQHGQYPAPSDDDVAAVTFALPGNPISLWWASFYGHLAVEGMLIASGTFEIDQELATAVTDGCRARLEMLLVLEHVRTKSRAVKVRIDLQDSADARLLSVSLLELAIRCRQSDIVALLFDTTRFDANVARAGWPLEYNFLLQLAVRQNDVLMVRLLLEAQDVDANMARSTRSLLDMAVTIGSDSSIHVDAQRQIVKLMLDSGKIHIPRHALHVCRSAEIGRLLLDAGAYYGDLAEHGTALQSAIVAGNQGTEMVRLLLGVADIKLDVNTKTGWGRILDERARLNDTRAYSYPWRPVFFLTQFVPESVKLLVNSDQVEINTKDELGMTPLWNAVDFRNDKLVNMLVHSKRLDLADQGPRALHIAIVRHAWEIAKTIIDSGKVDLNASHVGQTALHVAIARHWPALVELLLDSGKVDLNVEDDRNQTALQLAIALGHNDIARILRHYMQLDLSDESVGEGSDELESDAASVSSASSSVYHLDRLWE
ncbi:hypothetical protein LTR56_020528 [Elasticomyces elasticus]|nr:hypothetical protein LTR22_025113 [Elasticomyces elasticus]KAK3625267.1 hypothetical protein LTR56_020528 [Elasticomyces elasticus]KAK4905287.1 hypothetical protein LTR49_025395 [Elasticomyces elasticus]KAK5742313.1 hypothetical protein LTS12_024276 [Elasticomyces elasticus]